MAPDTYVSNVVKKSTNPEVDKSGFIIIYFSMATFNTVKKPDLC